MIERVKSESPITICYVKKNLKIIGVHGKTSLPTFMIVDFRSVMGDNDFKHATVFFF